MAMSGKEAVSFLGKHGFRLINTNGSHRKMYNPISGQKVNIPVHNNNDLPIGTEVAIFKKAGFIFDKNKKWREV